MKLTSQKLQTEWEEGAILDVSFPLPLAQLDFVKTSRFGTLFGLDWLSELTQSSSPLLTWRNDAGRWKASYPPASSLAPPRAAASSLVMLDHSLKPPCAFALTASSAPKSFPFFLQRSFVWLAQWHRVQLPLSLIRCLFWGSRAPLHNAYGALSSIGESLFTEVLEGPDW